MKKIKKLIKRIGIYLLFFLLLVLVAAPAPDTALSPEIYATIKKEQERLHHESTYYNATTELIDQVQHYIDYYSKGESELDAELIIRLSDKYDINLKLVLAQAHLESHFGTRGTASWTNSVFNVGTYDDGTILYTYADPNHSIEPYMDLMIRRYLVHKSYTDLLLRNKFVNDKGLRYASNRMYEVDLMKLVGKMAMETDIDQLQNERKTAAMLAEIEIPTEVDGILYRIEYNKMQKIQYLADF